MGGAVGRQQGSLHCAVEHQRAGGVGELGQPLPVARGQLLAQQIGQALHRQRQHHIGGLPFEALAPYPPARSASRLVAALQAAHPVAQSQLAAAGSQGLLQLLAEHLHGALQVPEPKRCLAHGQHGGAIEGGGALCWLLGVQA